MFKAQALSFKAHACRLVQRLSKPADLFLLSGAEVIIANGSFAAARRVCMPHLMSVTRALENKHK